MDFASLRAKLDNIAEELAQLPEQETVAVEEEEVVEDNYDHISDDGHKIQDKKDFDDYDDDYSGVELETPLGDIRAEWDGQYGRGAFINIGADNKTLGAMIQKIYYAMHDDDKGIKFDFPVAVGKAVDKVMAMGKDNPALMRKESVEEVEELSEFSPADMAAANKDSKAVQKSGSGMKSTSAAKPQAAGTLAQRLKTEEVEEEAVEEAMVEIPVQELADIMQLAGYTDYAERIEEYANEPEEQYMDAEEQLIGLSGGLNGPKTMHTPASGGDNPMDKEALKTVEENLYKSYKDFLEEAEIKDDEVVAEGKKKV